MGKNGKKEILDRKKKLAEGKSKKDGLVNQGSGSQVFQLITTN